jgi:hypothetical protein
MKGLAERTVEEAMNYFKRSMRSEFSGKKGPSSISGSGIMPDILPYFSFHIHNL